MLRSVVRVVAGATLVAGLAACGEPESTSGLPIYTPAAVASASATGSPAVAATPSPSTTGSASVGAADTISVTAGEIRARGNGKAVAAAWVRYWEERLTARHRPAAAERPELLTVASGDALGQVRAEVAGLRQRGRHTIGGVVVSVSAIRVGTAGARITSCLRSTTTDVDAGLRPVAPVVPELALDGTAVRAGSGWQITQVVVTTSGRC